MVAVAIPGTRHAKQVGKIKDKVRDVRAKFDDPRRAARNRTHRRDTKKLHKAQAKLELIELLAVKRFLNKAEMLAKLVFGFIVCLYAGKLSVTGVYDLVWETNIPLKIFAGIIITLGALAAGLSLRAKLKTSKNEPWLGVAGGGLIIVLGIQVFAFAKANPQIHNNTEFWHYLVPNANVRHLLFRALPEGLIGGVLWVYWNWNHYRRCAVPHWSEPVQRRAHWATPGDPKSAMAWQVWLTPVLLCAVAAIPAYLMFRGILFGHEHAAPVHSWAHREVPWKANIAAVEQNPAITDKLAATVTSGWPIWLIGFVCAQLARPVAFGVIDDAQRVQTLVDVSKSHGHLEGWHLHKALHFWQMRGYQGRIVEEFQHGQDYRSTQHEDRTGPVGYAQDQLDAIGSYVRVPIRLGQRLMIPLILVGWYYLYIRNG